MNTNRKNQDIPSEWEEVKKYLDRLDSDLLETVLSKEYSTLEEFYSSLREQMLEQLNREKHRVQNYRDELQKERSKCVELLLEKERLKNSI